ncbi:hypothetical protein PUN28_000169 [Cardiocondyla obscurior]|uniref:Secreted protein n=1 Tax=Cardiocondyla obscurior TaxID=286306 RepID=A0AAW2GY25_9HYME
MILDERTRSTILRLRCIFSYSITTAFGPVLSRARACVRRAPLETRVLLPIKNPGSADDPELQVPQTCENVRGSAPMFTLRLRERDN